jgi:hypothetical protein
VGTFRPTEFGLTVLPRVTALFPALLEFAELCRQQGCDIDEDWRDAVSATANAFSDTPEGRRVLDAAERVAELKVRDAAGGVVGWESLTISELDLLVPLSPAGGPMIQRRMRRLEGDPIRFMISMTLPALSVGVVERARARVPIRQD